MRLSAVHFASTVASLVLLAAVTALGTIFLLFYTPGPSRSEVTVVLTRGAHLTAIAIDLEELGIISDSQAFTWWMRLAGGSAAIRAGEYRFAPNVPGAKVARMLLRGDTLRRRFTVVEGQTVAQVLAAMMGAEGLEGPFPADVAEGSLLPETYLYEWGDTRAEVVERMQEAMDEALAQVWGGRDGNLPFDSPEQILILASIVEKETGVAEERAHIAGVFVNRLRLRMRLQSDPTVVYGLGRPVTEEEPLSRKELNADHAYNTYRHFGLPPGAIANPGLAALEAAARPLETGDLFFVADGTGGHAFSESLDEHNRNVARLRALERGG